MSDASAKETKGSPSFAELVHSLPATGDTVHLAGLAQRSTKEGHFRLTPQGGSEALELPLDAVRSHTVLHHQGDQLLVQIEADRSKVHPLLEQYSQAALLSGIRTYLTGSVWTVDHHVIPKVFETHQQAVPPGDPYRQAGQVPFVIGTPHHAPAQALNMQAAGMNQQVFKNPAAESAKSVVGDALPKHLVNDTGKETISDITLKEITETIKEVYKDPISDTVKEVAGDGTLFEPGGTLAEGTPFGPGGGINQF